MATALYLALRILEQLIDNEGAEFSLVVPVLCHQTYVNDCAFGADDQILACQTCDRIIQDRRLSSSK